MVKVALGAVEGVPSVGGLAKTVGMLPGRAPYAPRTRLASGVEATAMVLVCVCCGGVYHLTPSVWLESDTRNCSAVPTPSGASEPSPPADRPFVVVPVPVPPWLGGTTVDVVRAFTETFRR